MPVYDRYALEAGAALEGPAIVEEREATTIVPDACALTVDEGLNLRLTLAETAPSRIVVGADTALEEAVARIEADPVGLEIMWSRMINIAEECWQTVIRTAFSLIIGEAQDFACEILDAGGRQIVHSPRAMPVFNLTLPIAVNAMIERYPPETLAPGDVLVTNDPWLCAGHLFDIAVAVPVFRDGKVVAFCGVVGHVTDIGGTKDSLNAREIYEEGFQIPPMKLFRAGKPNEDLLTLLAENVRRPDQVLGDGARPRRGRAHRGRADWRVHGRVRDARSRGPRRRRPAAGGVGDAKGHLGTAGRALRAPGRGGRDRHPHDLPDPDLDRGRRDRGRLRGRPPANGPGRQQLHPHLHEGAHHLSAQVHPLAGGAGQRGVATGRCGSDAPAKSIMNCDRPLAVNMRTRTGWYIAPNVFGALAEAASGRVQAFTGLPASALFYGIGPDGAFYSDHLFQGGGQGASKHGDGHSGLLYPTSAGNTSVELFETRVPALVLEKAFTVDSGGPGRQRGGLGQVISARKLENGRKAVPGRALSHGRAEAGVGPLRRAARGTRRRPRRTARRGDGGRWGWRAVRSLETTAEYAELRVAGGSGFGDPLERPFEAVQRDLDAGYVTAEGARRDYGCVVGRDGRIDRTASERPPCRAHRRHRRVPARPEAHRSGLTECATGEEASHEVPPEPRRVRRRPSRAGRSPGAARSLRRRYAASPPGRGDGNAPVVARRPGVVP